MPRSSLIALASAALATTLLASATAAAQEIFDTGPLPSQPTGPAARFRGGVGLLAGATAPGALLGFGLQARFGWQFSELLAVYGEPEIFLGFPVGWNAHGGLFAGGFSPEVELTFAGTFFVAAGPAILVGAFSPTTGDIGMGVIPGAKLRLGAGFGTRTPARRHQFTVAVEPRLLYSPGEGAAGFFTLALGYDAK